MVRSSRMVLDLGGLKIRLADGEGTVLAQELNLLILSPDGKHIVALGNDAAKLPQDVNGQYRVVFPFRDGRVIDHKLAVLYIQTLLKRLGMQFFPLGDHRVVVGCAPDASVLERQVIRQCLAKVGWNHIHILPSPYLAAIGAGVSLSAPQYAASLSIGYSSTTVVLTAAGLPTTVWMMPFQVKRAERELTTLLRQGGYPIDLSFSQLLTQYIGAGSATVTKPARRRGKQTEAIPAYALKELCEPFVTEITSGLTACIEQFDHQALRAVIEQGIAVTGGLAEIPGFSLMLTKAVELPCFAAPSSSQAVLMGGTTVLSLSHIDERLMWSYKKIYFD